MRSLSNRLTTLQREVTPRLMMTGTPVQVGALTNKQVFLNRKVNLGVTLTGTNNLDVTPSTLATALPDGARLLKVVATNHSTRNLRMTVPAGTVLFVRGGKTNNEVSDMTRENWAPLSRFPTVSLNVPDTLSNSLDTNDNVALLFRLSCADAGSTASVNVTLKLTYQTMV